MNTAHSRPGVGALLAVLASSLAAVLPAQAQDPGRGTLLRRAVLPSQTFASGPPAGQFEDRGTHGWRLDAPRFQRQPVQGISAIRPGPRRGSFWALSDNGFGTKWNSLDYRTCIYLFDEDLRLLRRIELRDPARRFPYPLILEADPARPLTGGDIDPESLVVMDDGSFWIGDEHGPWLLHFSRSGELLAPPVDTILPEIGVLRSPAHPEVLAGRERASIGASSGFEGLAKLGSGATQRLYAALEKPLPADAGQHRLRLLEFDPMAGRWTSQQWTYPLDGSAQAVGELSPAWDGGLLWIERDGAQGELARHKMIFHTPSPARQRSDSALPKSLILDLLQIDDPDRLRSDQPGFRFSYWTIEAVQVIERDVLLIANDNNFPSADPTEWIWVRIQP